MYKTIAILLSLLLILGILSCNLDGSGIFLTISESTEIADSNLATEPVRDILYKDSADTMYILHGTTMKKANISVADPTWTNVDFSKPISEAVYFDGVTDKLYFSSINTNSTKTIYVGDVAAPAPANAITSLEDIEVIDMIIDGANVHVITYDQSTATPEIKIYTIDTTDDSVILSGSFSAAVAPTSVHFLDNGTKYLIFVFFDETKGFVNKYVTLPAFSVVTELTDPLFQVSDNAAENSPIIGTYTYNGKIYLVTNEGILITSTTIDNSGSTFSAVNNSDSSEFMSIVLNPSGSTASVFSIPMTIVTKLDTTTELLIIGGVSDIYYYDIATPTTIPIEFTSDYAFYSNVSSTQILDFYNVPGDGDFSLYTATSDKWIWETVDEETASIQLL
jgi:hypothetical protein